MDSFGVPVNAKSSPVIGNPPPAMAYRPITGYAMGAVVFIILIVIIMIMSIVVIGWLAKTGLDLAKEVLPNGKKRGFPVSIIVAIAFAVLVLIVTIALIVWLSMIAKGSMGSMSRGRV